MEYSRLEKNKEIALGLYTRGGEGQDSLTGFTKCAHGLRIAGKKGLENLSLVYTHGGYRNGTTCSRGKNTPDPGSFCGAV
jgi:hypothetical protein